MSRASWGVPRDVLERGGGRLRHPSSLGLPMVPAEGGPKIFKLKSPWHRRPKQNFGCQPQILEGEEGGGPKGGGYTPSCDIPSGCCSFTGPWTVTRSSPSHVASGHCFLSAAAAGALAGVVSAFAEPSSKPPPRTVYGRSNTSLGVPMCPRAFPLVPEPFLRALKHVHVSTNVPEHVRGGWGGNSTGTAWQVSFEPKAPSAISMQVYAPTSAPFPSTTRRGCCCHPTATSR